MRREAQRMSATRTIIHYAVLAAALSTLPSLRGDLQGQTVPAPAAPIPPRPAPPYPGYTFERKFDAEIADGDVHRVLFENEQVMLMEVSNPPGLDVKMHGHPYPSVFARDSATGPRRPDAPPMPTAPGGYDERQVQDSAWNDMGLGQGAAPRGMQWPIWQSAAPQAPHRPYNANVYPFHFYRIEFYRLDGEEFQTRWREWYPWMATPAKAAQRPTPSGPPLSAAWPYPHAYDAVLAAPDNYRLLFEDGKARLVEVVIRPGETTPMHGHPYPSVLASTSGLPDAAALSEKRLDPASKLDGQGSGPSTPPTVHQMKWPICSTLAPQAPHTLTNRGKAPVHYYRIEFKRIDGDEFGANWRKWYPWMQYMQYMR
jgi:quercetin dioxygenase-like cupin family protein